VTAVLAPETQPDEGPRPTGVDRAAGRPRIRRYYDAAVVLVGLSLAYVVTSGIWTDPLRRTIAQNAGDHAFFEWLLGYGAWALSHGSDPFFVDATNVPFGVNLAVNTSITAYAVLLAPVTYVFGPPVTFVLVLTLNLAGTAFAWYWLLSRHVVRHPAAAAVAGLFAGFAPGFVSHANSHLNWTSGWIAPVLILWVLKLRRPGHWLRTGLILGVLVAACFTIAAEGLFFTALACLLFFGTWALHPATRAEARATLPHFLKGLGTAGGVALALLGYPLWMHFAGPQSFQGTGYSQAIHAEDLTAYTSYAGRSLAAAVGLGRPFVAPNATEETSFFGAPLVILLVLCLVVLFRTARPGRRATLLGLTVTGGVFLILSFGPRAKINTTITDFPLPYAAIQGLPLFDSALPARMALVVAGVAAVVLALALDRVPARRRPRIAWGAAFAVALVPLLPTPLLATDRTGVPDFIAHGTWQKYVPEGSTLTSFPLALDAYPDAQRWQAYTMGRGGPTFAIPGGYFLGPGEDGRGRVGADPRDTSWLLERAGRLDEVRNIGPWHRENARRDLKFWKVSAVVIPDQQTGSFWPVTYDGLMRSAILLLGPPERVDDVWLWRITPDGTVAR
jgi:hypothetical protein